MWSTYCAPPLRSVGRIFKNGGGGGAWRALTFEGGGVGGGGGGLTGPYLLEGGCWERGGDFFQVEEVAIVT